MRYSKRSTLEARRIIRQGNAKPLFWSITEGGWIKLQFYEIDLYGFKAIR